MPRKAQPDRRRKYSIKWTPRLSDAIDAEVARRRADADAHPFIAWDRSLVSEDILRSALGVGDEG